MFSQLQRVARLFIGTLMQEVRQLRWCRQCGGKISCLVDSGCPHCGAADAARVPLLTSAVVLAIPFSILGLYLAYKWVC